MSLDILSIAKMNRYLIILSVFALLGIIAFYLTRGNNAPIESIPNQLPTPSGNPIQQKVNLQASFAIFTNGTFRIFTDPKYHNRSEDVYITADNPNVITVKKKGITWGDFFKTLPTPMKVTKDCLYTGTGQTLCNSDNQTLKFYINGEKDGNALEKEIKENDKLLISFGSKDDPQL